MGYVSVNPCSPRHHGQREHGRTDGHEGVTLQQAALLPGFEDDGTAAQLDSAIAYGRSIDHTTQRLR